jgi:hypothetical protein
MAIRASTLGGGSSGAATNDFTISVGSSGHTNVTLATSFPIGNYICTSSLSDATLDIYLLNEDGSSAGFANATTGTTTITAEKTFNKVVIYGAENNDTLTFQFKYVFSPTNVTTNFLGAPPQLSSASTNSMPSVNDTVVLTGSNFATDVTVTFTGADNVARSAKSVSRTSSTSITVTRPDTLPSNQNPYTLTATNPSISASSPTSANRHKINNAVYTVPLAPTIGAATAAGFYGSATVSFTAAATGPAASSYTVTSSGGHTGTGSSSPITVIGLTQGASYTFTVKATNANGDSISSSASSNSVTAPSKQLRHTFTSNGTWTNPGLPAGISVDVVSVGAGGGGASGSSGNQPQSSNGGFGGGGGGSGYISVSSISPTGNVAYTIGAAGSGGANAANSVGNSGSSGNTTTFSTVSGSGGGGGARPGIVNLQTAGVGGSGQAAGGGGGAGGNTGSGAGGNGGTSTNGSSGTGTSGGAGAQGWTGGSPGSAAGSVSLSGVSLTLGGGGGGGGGSRNSGTGAAGSGGTGAGSGTGGDTTATAGSATAFGCGGGGGGGGFNGSSATTAGGTGGNGAAGVIYLVY